MEKEASKFIIIKFAELYLKGKNKNQFINSLIKSIKDTLFGCKYRMENKKDMFFIFCEDKNFDFILNTLKFIPGIAWLNVCYQTTTDISKINQLALSLTENSSSFKIELKRRYKNFMERNEIINGVAKYVLENNNKIKVDVNNPNITLNIVIDSSSLSYIWVEKVMGVGGLPIGNNGSCLSLLSGGIDSPVASFLVQKRGQIVDYLTFITDDVTDKTINKLKALIKTITLDGKLHKAKLYIVDFTKIQHELMHTKNPKYRITLMRRSFYRIAEKLAIKYKYNALVCGDSLGQVASQTIESISTISNVCNNIQIFRPLLTFDKQEIIEISKKIGTYDISISEHEDVCSLFAPENPVTKPSINVAIDLENDLKLLNYIEESVINKIKVIILD